MLVVGINPGYNPAERIPCFGSSLEDYVDFYRRRFIETCRDHLGRPVSEIHNGRRRSIRHYVVVERMLQEGLGSRAIGQGAAYADAVPWKAKRVPRFPDGVVELARTRIEFITAALHPKLVVALGRPTAQLLGVRAAMTAPRVEVTRLGRWTGPVLTAFHPNAHFLGAGTQGAYLTEVASTIQRQLRENL